MSVKNVNEIAFGYRHKVNRTKREQEMLIESLREAQDYREKEIVKCAARRYQNVIPNMGETGYLELLGAVGIFLTQFTPSEIHKIDLERQCRREYFEPIPVIKGRL